VGDKLERDLLPLVEALHPCAFDRADVYEYILPAVVRLDESVALLAIEPLHGSLRHIGLLSGRCALRPRVPRSRFVRDLEESRQSDAGCAARPSRSAESSTGAMWCIVVGVARGPIHEQARSHAQLAREVLISS